MSDKLEKTNHKKGYYRTRLILTVVLFLLGAIAIATIPVGFTYKIAQAKAAEAEQSSLSEKESQEEEPLLSYEI